MKKCFCILICLLLCSLVFLPAGAENTEDETRKLDRALGRMGLAMTARLMGNACDRLDSPKADSLRAYYNSFSGIDFLRPYKMLVVDLTAEQAGAAKRALSADQPVDIAPALAAFLNKDYPEYAKAVEQVLPDETSASEEALALVLLPYERHIAAVSFSGRKVRSALIISMESSSRSLNAGEIAFYAEQIGLSGLNVRMYAEQELKDLLELKAWQAAYHGDSGTLVNALKHSEGRMRRLFPLTLKEDTLSDSFRFYILRSFLENSMKDNLAGAARLVSGTFLPMMAETDPDAVKSFMDSAKQMIDTARDDRRPPEITYGEPVLPSPEGTYVFVIELHNPERGTESFYDPVLEAALPAANIPETPDAADYIIRCRVTYSDTPDLSNSSSAVYCPTTDITVHDARTGDLICSLGSVTRPRPSGVVMVSKGNTYYYPYLDQIWEKARTIFAVVPASAEE